MKDYNKTWRYRYYSFRQNLSIWCEAKIEIYYRSRKTQWLAKKLYNANLFHDWHWFSKIVDLINEIHGRQCGQFYSPDQTKQETDKMMLAGGGWY